MPVHKAQLRNTLKKLRSLPLDRSESASVAMVPQEMPDFLAMLARLKPVFLLGRGFDDHGWIDGLLGLARQMKLHVIAGPKWHAVPENAGLPDWYDTVAGSTTSQETVHYICRASSVAGELLRIAETGKITIEQEARLLGYPVCCVDDHYRRMRLMNEGFSKMLHRTANGEEAEMRRIVQEVIAMSLETDEEISLIREATGTTPAPFTSINMCPACASNPKSSSLKISATYAGLARTIDPALAREIKVAHARLAQMTNL